MIDLKFVELNDIAEIDNYRSTEPISAKDPEIIELVASVKLNGILQPILLRPSPPAAKHKKRFEMIFGHRRILAGRIAGLAQIPAQIKEVADDQILIHQVTENLQRKDVHPMDEAIAFKSLIDKRAMTIENVAALAAKSIPFVTQRLKLNDLIPELQKDFKRNKFSIAHALEFCRISPDDQKKAMKSNKNGNDGYDTVKRLQWHIQNEVVHNLSKAPWKKDDTTLVPAAGACKVCPKRSGANRSLFGDILADDRCFDGSCYDKKMDAWMAVRIAEVLETKPNIQIVCREPKNVPANVIEACGAMNVPILQDDKHFDTYHYKGDGSKFNKKAEGFWIEGYNKGTFGVIYLPGGKVSSSGAGAGSTSATRDAAKAGKLTAAMIDEEISRIREREKRAKEIDLNNIRKATLEQLEKKKKDALAKKWQQIDRGIMIWILLQETGQYGARDRFRKMSGMPPARDHRDPGFDESYFMKLSEISNDQLAYLVRSIALEKGLHQSVASSDVCVSDTPCRIIALYSGIDIEKIELNQSEKAKSRADRIKKAIAGWQEKKGELKGKLAKQSGKSAKKLEKTR
jgi:ParB/RepB/Spo0J family partition protein